MKTLCSFKPHKTWLCHCSQMTEFQFLAGHIAPQPKDYISQQSLQREFLANDMLADTIVWDFQYFVLEARDRDILFSLPFFI